MVWLGIAIVIGTFWLIYKNYEARLVLFLSGIVMTLIGMMSGSSIGLPAAIDAFVKQFVNAGLVPTYTTVMGFGYVMSYTKCADHLVNALVRPLSRVPSIVIPGAVIITWFLNIVLPSAVGIAAAVGVLLIPALIALKVRPVMAASAVFLGTWGSVASPGLMFNPQIADIAYKAGEIEAPDAMIVIFAEFMPAFVGACFCAVVLAVIARFMKEGVGSQTEIAQVEGAPAEEIKVNYFFALVPLIPLCLLVLASKQVGVLPTKVFTVPCCMLIGTGIGLLIGIYNKLKPGEISKKFCRGCGDAFCEVALLIASAAVFASGMKSIGLTGALVDVMKGSQSVAMASAVVGPWLMAIVCGSGNAAALAFNEAITPHAADFGMTVVQLGAVAQVAAGLGRTVSPVAGGIIVIASIANVNPIDICKRTFVPVVVALAIFTVGMYWF